MSFSFWPACLQLAPKANLGSSPRPFLRISSLGSSPLTLCVEGGLPLCSPSTDEWALLEPFAGIAVLNSSSIFKLWNLSNEFGQNATSCSATSIVDPSQLLRFFWLHTICEWLGLWQNAQTCNPFAHFAIFDPLMSCAWHPDSMLYDQQTFCPSFVTVSIPASTSGLFRSAFFVALNFFLGWGLGVPLGQPC